MVITPTGKIKILRSKFLFFHVVLQNTKFNYSLPILINSTQKPLTPFITFVNDVTNTDVIFSR